MKNQDELKCGYCQEPAKQYEDSTEPLCIECYEEELEEGRERFFAPCNSLMPEKYW